MFFLFSFGSNSKSIFSQPGVCPYCGKMCRFEIFLNYHYISLFFIPLLKWGKQYYMRSSCCGAVYALPTQIGKDIQKGLITSIEEIEKKEYISGSSHSEKNYCTYCGAPRDTNTNYCAKCGHKF